MATRQQNKITLDVAADSSSLDSLSFAGLVCIQEQQSTTLPPINRAKKSNKEDPEFEFSPATPETTAHILDKKSPADATISNSRLLPQAFLCQPKQSQANNQPSPYKGTSPTFHTGRTRLSENKKYSSKASQRSNHKVRNQSNREHNAPGSWFGQKFFQSFVSPCRECHAVQPTMKAHTVQQ